MGPKPSKPNFSIAKHPQLISVDESRLQPAKRRPTSYDAMPHVDYDSPLDAKWMVYDVATGKMVPDEQHYRPDDNAARMLMDHEFLQKYIRDSYSKELHPEDYDSHGHLRNDPYDIRHEKDFQMQLALAQKRNDERIIGKQIAAEQPKDLDGQPIDMTLLSGGNDDGGAVVNSVRAVVGMIGDGLHERYRERHANDPNYMVEQAVEILKKNDPNYMND